MADASVTPSQEPTQVPRLRNAYQQLVEEIRAVPDSELIAINLDIPTAVTTALGALPDIRALRDRIVKELPAFDIARFDKLEGYTLAVGHAHALYLAASAPAESIPALSEAAADTREVLLSDASALAKRGMLDGQRLKELKGPVGYRNLAFDLFTLATLMREQWAKISAKTAVQLSELDQAETLADRLLTAIGEREQGPASVAATAETRQRAFALFVNSYDQARRAVSHLRWNEGDVDAIAPSLYAGRNSGSRRKNGDSETPAPAPTAPKAPAGEVPAPVPESAGTPVGTPDSDPFVRA